MEFIFSEQDWKDKDGKVVVTHIEVMESNGYAHCRVSLYPNENIVEATAIANQWGNPPAHVIDNSIDTRWSQDGLMQWLNLELDTVRLVTAVDLAFYQGTVRFSYFDIQVSLDGYDFMTVMEGCSTSGLTDDMERYYLPEANVSVVK